MSNRFNADFETRSEIDLKTCGAFRYASDPSAAILLAAICRGDEPVRIWDAFATPEANAPALALLRELVSDPANIVFAFNASFEAAISSCLWESTFGFPAPLLSQWRCSAALCRIACIPANLEGAAKFLNLPAQKDKAGGALIQKFSILQKDGEWINPDYPKPLTIAGEKVSAAEAWKMFSDYCIQDVETERAMGRRLVSMELKGWVLQSFTFDLKMNALGVPVNLEAVDVAQEIAEESTGRLAERFRQITGLNPGQQAKVLAWLRERGYAWADMQSATVAEALGDPAGISPEALEALEIKSMVGFAALKKLPTMKRASCADGRIRGMFRWYGARTGRWSSGIVQLQNLKRATSLSESCYRAIRDGGMDAPAVEILFGPPLKILSTAIRHFIDPGQGRQLLGADLAQIEARVLAWLAGHEDLLQTFRDGLDLYRSTIAWVLNIGYDEVNKHQRTLSKALVLACGYSGGQGAMTAACKMYGLSLTEKEKRSMVKGWRKTNQPITAFWKTIGEAMVEAIRSPGAWVQATRNIRIATTGVLGYREMVIQLPSKRWLHYPYPEVRAVYKIKRPRKLKPGEVLEDDDDGKEWVEIPRGQAVHEDGSLRDGVWETSEVSYLGQLGGSVSWGRVRLTPGTAVENICQATAGDFLSHGALQADQAGYDVIATVHDEIVSDYHPERGNSVEGLVEALTTLPSWAPDFPLAAVGGLTEFFTKD